MSLDDLSDTMSLRLAASSDSRAIAICEHLLALVLKLGTSSSPAGATSDFVSLISGPWTMNHWAPSGALAADEAASPAYRRALERQMGGADLPYGLEVWRGLKVLSVLWSAKGDFKIVEFVRGPWEDEALLLSADDTGWLDDDGEHDAERSEPAPP